MTAPHYPRLVRPRLEEALADTPVVLVHGPRQCGKTTLAREVGDAAGYAYRTFDDDTVRAGAEADPVGFVADLPERAVLDEVQRVPGLFTSLKAAVDRDRTPGRFLLTGSANVLFVPRLSDSLAGRMEALRLHPLSQHELAGLAGEAPTFVERLFRGEVATTGAAERLGPALAETVAGGGYPAALARAASHRRAAWYRAYVETLVQRDVRDLAAIHNLDALPRLLAVVASQTARLLNVADLSGPFQLSRPTVRDYVTLLSRVFLLDELPPWHSNRLKRLVKTAKLHAGDTGVACALLGVGADDLWADRGLYGQMLETFVVGELRRQASGHAAPIAFHHLRDRDGAEVDLVMERSGRALVGVEVKASSTVRGKDFSGLRKLQEAVGDRLAVGAVLYDGEATVPFGDRLWAVPIRRLWEAS
ncbi:MAG TPA: ATP-binding protein [Bacteroidetes bacterium]|nr:ATP-binding protein [Bacteroidota bacterium]HIL58538.1 ATP-binding protein [Rhodothermales bacterium]